MIKKVKMELKKALQTALDFEEKGHHIYEEVSNKTENQIVEKTFRYLANQELIHIEVIKEYMKEEKIELKGDKLKETKKFFSMTVGKFKEMLETQSVSKHTQKSSISDETELSDDDLKAHETALELEQKSYDFYKEQREKTADKDLKKFFGFLMEQENAHYMLVQKAYDYMKNPDAFYAEEEKWVVEG